MRGQRLQAMRLHRLSAGDHDARGTVGDLAGGGGRDDAAGLQQLDGRDAFQRGVEADAFVHHVRLALALLACAP